MMTLLKIENNLVFATLFIAFDLETFWIIFSNWKIKFFEKVFNFSTLNRCDKKLAKIHLLF